jgi:hypothetical protein
VVPVPDPRLQQLADIVHPQKVIPAKAGIHLLSDSEQNHNGSRHSPG